MKLDSKSDYWWQKLTPNPVSDRVLQMPERWFTGEEWGNGTAVEALRADYIKAVKDYLERQHD